MPTAYIERRTTAKGRRYTVRYRLGGREAKLRSAGTFRTLREAEARLTWVTDQLAAGHAPDHRAHLADQGRTVGDVVDAYLDGLHLTTRPATEALYRHMAAHLVPLRRRVAASVTHRDVQDLVTGLAATHAPHTVRQVRGVLRRAYQHAGLPTDAVLDARVRMPRKADATVRVPSADDVDRMVACLPGWAVLPVLILEATGMRVGELASARWEHVDWERGAIQVTAERSKTSRARLVTIPDDLMTALSDHAGPELRDPHARLWPGRPTRDAGLSALVKAACVRGGVDPPFGTHRLRHRRVSLWHRQGIEWARIGEWVGQRDLATTAGTYTHVISDREIDRRPHLTRYGAHLMEAR